MPDAFSVQKSQLWLLANAPSDLRHTRCRLHLPQVYWPVVTEEAEPDQVEVTLAFKKFERRVEDERPIHFLELHDDSLPPWRRRLERQSLLRFAPCAVRLSQLRNQPGLRRQEASVVPQKVR